MKKKIREKKKRKEKKRKEVHQQRIKEMVLLTVEHNNIWWLCYYFPHSIGEMGLGFNGVSIGSLHTEQIHAQPRNEHAPAELDRHGRTWMDGTENQTQEWKTIRLMQVQASHQDEDDKDESLEGDKEGDGENELEYGKIEDEELMDAIEEIALVDEYRYDQKNLLVDDLDDLDNIDNDFMPSSPAKSLHKSELVVPTDNPYLSESLIFYFTSNPMGLLCQYRPVKKNTDGITSNHATAHLYYVWLLNMCTTLTINRSFMAIYVPIFCFKLLLFVLAIFVIFKHIKNTHTIAGKRLHNMMATLVKYNTIYFFMFTGLL
ncbi:hypothetical protein BDR06DRAFT_971621 [Suillus hirtellus]|nr:hypothetical protein BDR06DRAFT_971621 [Suillus hirtellus]